MAHSDFAGSGRLRGAADSGQPVRVSDFSRQPRLLATTLSAPRQCLAWLSPTSATVSFASCGSAPELQTSGSDASGEQKPFGASSAAAGVGLTISRSLALWQGLRKSRDAAP